MLVKETDILARRFYTMYLAVSGKQHGIGGYGVILVNDRGEKREISGGCPFTIPNRLGLIGLANALEMHIKRPSSIIVYSSQERVQDINSPIIFAGEATGWKNANGTRIAKADLYARLLPHLRQHRIHGVRIATNSDRAILPPIILDHLDQALSLARNAKKTSNLVEDDGYALDHAHDKWRRD